MSDSNFNNTTKLPVQQSTPVTATLASNFTVSTDYPTFANVTGLAVTFTTTRTNQPVLICLNATGVGGVNTTFVMGYNLDAGTTIDLIASQPGATLNANLSTSFVVTPSTAASHTVQIRSAKGTNNGTLYGADSTTWPCFVTAILL